MAGQLDFRFFEYLFGRTPRTASVAKHWEIPSLNTSTENFSSGELPIDVPNKRQFSYSFEPYRVMVCGQKHGDFVLDACTDKKIWLKKLNTLQPPDNKVKTRKLRFYDS